MNNFFGNNNKKIQWPQICFLLCILMLTFCVFTVLSSESSSILSSAKLISIPLFITGAVSTIIAATKKRTLKNFIWLLFDGVSTISLSVFLILNSPLTFNLLWLCFGVWKIVLGIFKICESVMLKKDKISSYPGFLAAGIAEILSGVYFLISPIDSLAGYNIALAIALIIQISAYALRYYLYPEMSEDI